VEIDSRIIQAAIVPGTSSCRT